MGGNGGEYVVVVGVGEGLAVAPAVCGRARALGQGGQSLQPARKVFTIDCTSSTFTAPSPLMSARATISGSVCDPKNTLTIS